MAFPELSHHGSVKVESMGCDTPGCATGLQVYDTPAGDQHGLLVWPNPTSGAFNVQGLRFKVSGPQIIRVYNSQVVKVAEVEVAEGTENVAIDIGEHPTGIYFVQLTCPGTTAGVQKIIKQ